MVHASVLFILKSSEQLWLHWDCHLHETLHQYGHEHVSTHMHAHIVTTLKCHLVSAKLKGCDRDPEEGLTCFEGEVTGPPGDDLSIPWIYPSDEPGCPPHGRLH